MKNLLSNKYNRRSKTLLATAIALLLSAPGVGYAEDLDELKMFVTPVKPIPNMPLVPLTASKNDAPEVVQRAAPFVSKPVTELTPQSASKKETLDKKSPEGGFFKGNGVTQPEMVNRQIEPATQSDIPVSGIFVTSPVKAPVIGPSITEAEEVAHLEPAVQLRERPETDLKNSRSKQFASEAELRAQFARAVRTALMISPQMKSSQAQSEAAEANIGEAKGQRWPQVDLNAASPSKQFGDGVRRDQGNQPTLGVSIATNLYDFGQTSSTIESREEQFSASSQAVLTQREEIAWQLSNTLIEVNKQRMIVGLSKQYVARMNDLTTMLSGIVQTDPGRRSELTQARGRLLQAQSLLENAESRVRDGEITLNRLMGGQQVALLPPSSWGFNFGSLDNQLKALERHPGILKASAEARAALKEAEAIKASGKPKLTWVVSKSTAEDERGRQQSWQTGLNVSWGLFRGGSNSASERAAMMRAESSRQIVQEQLREYENRVRAADQDAHSMQSRSVLFSNLTLESDRIRKDFFDQWYHLGKRTLLDVLSAETDYYNNRVNEVSNRMDSYAAIFRGYASAGYLVNWLENGKS